MEEKIVKDIKVVFEWIQGSSSFKLLANNIEYGMSQNPYTKDYILVLNEKYLEKYHKEYCNKCGEKYAIEIYKWCKSCQIDFLKIILHIGPVEINKLMILFKKSNCRVTSNTSIAINPSNIRAAHSSRKINWFEV
ncbi:unnamed protein product [Rhizophagus irregularis]|nr:unnamed protein product [Rhizophagus irregularis]